METEQILQSINDKLMLIHQTKPANNVKHFNDLLRL